MTSRVTLLSGVKREELFRAEMMADRGRETVGGVEVTAKGKVVVVVLVLGIALEEED